MILYEYECAVCKKTFEAFSIFEERNSHECPKCKSNCPRIFSSPRIFVERAGCIEGRPDEFWERADRHKEGQLKKRVDADREKVRYGDKETMKNLETAHTNLMRQDEPERAEAIEKKVDAAK